MVLAYRLLALAIPRDDALNAAMNLTFKEWMILALSTAGIIALPLAISSAHQWWMMRQMTSSLEAYTHEAAQQMRRSTDEMRRTMPQPIKNH